jgi:hypothetical protein
VRLHDRTHQDIRDAIRSQRLLSIPDTMRFLEWRTPNGCATCRPAINYYLISTWPKEALDDPQSRFINERAHANIQKDGTYSVIPRMWGGETNASELRRIADVVDKYQIRTVKVTGGQRIDLLGVKKADLPAVWADLDMPSGHAYAKALRTVKTCVGSEWCRFGTRTRPRWARRSSAHCGGCTPAQGEARGVRLSAQLRRVRHQGCRRDRRRVGVGDLRRRQRRHQDGGRAVPGQGEDGRRSARVRRRVPRASIARKAGTSSVPSITSRASGSIT